MTSYLDFKLPYNPRYLTTGLHCLGVAAAFTLTSAGQVARRGGRVVWGVLCQAVSLRNTLDRAVWVTLKTHDDKILCETMFLAAESMKVIDNMERFSGLEVRLFVTDTALFCPRQG